MSVHPEPLQLSTAQPSKPYVELFPQPNQPLHLHNQQQPRHSRVHRGSRGAIRFSVSSRIVFRCLWLAILSLHAIDGLATLGTMALYFYVADPMNSYKFAALKLPIEFFDGIGYSFGFVAALHGFEVSKMFFYSLRQRQLAFTAPALAAPRPSVDVVTGDLERTGSVVIVQRFLSRTWFQVRRPWKAFFSRNGYFGLNGPLFEIWFQLRETIEIAMQSYQAYTLSYSVPRRWINHLAVMAVVLNCFSTPMAHLALRGKALEKKRRLLCLVADLVLDFSCSVIIPLCVVYPYWHQFDKKTGQFRDELLYDDVWYVNALTEGRQLFITSLPDHISTLLPHLGILTCLYNLKTLLRHAPVVTKPMTFVPEEAVRREPAVVEQLGSGNNTVVQQFVPSGSVASNRHLFVNIVFVLFGIVIAAIHVYAQTVSNALKPGCKLQLSPWFATNYSCSVMEVNCYRQGITGEQHQLEAVIGELQRDALLTLLITHCPNLHVPPVIQQFAYLSGLEIFNCSITEWGSDAAILRGYHDRMNYAYVMSSTLTSLPEGLLHQNLPVDFSHLFFERTKLSELPEDINRYWGAHEWVYLGFEYCDLREIPLALGEIPMWQLSLKGNEIEVLPDLIFQHQHFLSVVLSENPLRALPSTIGDTSDLEELRIRYTNISAAPEWLLHWVVAVESSHTEYYLVVSDTPLCGSNLTSNAFSGGYEGDTKSLASDQLDVNAALVKKMCGFLEIPDDSTALIVSQRTP